MIEDATWFRTQRSLLERASNILDSYLTSWKELLDVERILIVLPSPWPVVGDAS